MEETRKFKLRTVLSVVTGRLLAEPKGERDNGIGDLYQFLTWLAMDDVYTMTIPRFMDEYKPVILERYPELGFALAAEKRLEKWLKTHFETCPEEGIKMWVAEMKTMCPALKDEYEFPQMPIYHNEIDPVEEHEQIVPKEKLIILETEAE